jgi:hypothetical protein
LLDVQAWSFACPHFLSFFTPVAAFEQDVSHCLTYKSTVTFVGVGLVDFVEVCVQADFVSAHLYDD